MIRMSVGIDTYQSAKAVLTGSAKPCRQCAFDMSGNRFDACAPAAVKREVPIDAPRNQHSIGANDFILSRLRKPSEQGVHNALKGSHAGLCRHARCLARVGTAVAPYR